MDNSDNSDIHLGFWFWFGYFEYKKYMNYLGIYEFGFSFGVFLFGSVFRISGKIGMPLLPSSIDRHTKN